MHSGEIILLWSVAGDRNTNGGIGVQLIWSFTNNKRSPKLLTQMEWCEICFSVDEWLYSVPDCPHEVSTSGGCALLCGQSFMDTWAKCKLLILASIFLMHLGQFATVCLGDQGIFYSILVFLIHLGYWQLGCSRGMCVLFYIRNSSVTL